MQKDLEQKYSGVTDKSAKPSNFNKKMKSLISSFQLESASTADRLQSAKSE